MDRHKLAKIVILILLKKKKLTDYRTTAFHEYVIQYMNVYSLLQHTPGPASCLSALVSLKKTSCPVC